MGKFHTNSKMEYLDRSFKKYRDAGVITDRDETIVRIFTTELHALKSVQITRLLKVTYSLIQWRKFIHAEYLDMTTEDILMGITAFKAGTTSRGTAPSQNTLHDYMRIIKQFATWLVDNEHNTHINLKKLSQLKPPPVDFETATPNDLLTFDEVQQLVTAALNSRDKALLAVLYETGGRIAEVCQLVWSNIEFDEFGAKVRLPASMKNPSVKDRFSRLVWANTYLATWSNQYPGEALPDAPVFTQMDGSPINYYTVQAILKRLTKRMGFPKHVTPHLFRKSRITHLVELGTSETILKKALWGNTDTAMMRTYVKLSEDAIDAEFLAIAGIEVPREKSKPSPLKAVRCYNCGKDAEPGVDFCSRCASPLSDRARLSYERAKKARDAHPEVRMVALGRYVADHSKP